MATHTKGPWQLIAGFADWGMPKVHSIVPLGAKDQYGGDVIAEIPSVQPHCMGAKKSDVERAAIQDANARLIAAAPELLAQLQEVTQALHSACLVISDDTARQMALGMVKDARAAIAKARGE